MSFLTSWLIFEVFAWIVLIVVVNIMLPSAKKEKP